MKKISTLILCVLTAFTVSSQTLVKKVSSGLAIDGHLSEEFWEITNPISINFGGSDNTANFGVLWDDNYLYVGVEVADNLLCNGRRQAFYDDGIEICIDGNHDQSTSFDDNDLQLAKPVKSYWVQEMNQNFDGIIHQYKPTATGYSMEFAIPWSIINTTPATNNLVGFNLVVNDDDDAGNNFNSPSQLIWSGSGSYFLSPQNWGSIQLSSETVGFAENYLALLSPNEGEFLINGNNTDIEWFSNNIDNIKIEYSTDNGSQWSVITESTNAATGVFQWQTNAPASEQFLIRISDASNNALSDESDIQNIVSEAWNASEILIPSLWHNYMWPYNAYYPEDQNGINGHVGNSCGPATLARIVHSWEFPRQGSGSLSFTDYFGTYWSADFENTIYNYDNMPNNLPWEATEPQYTDVATLVFHTAVAMHDVYGSGTDLENMSYAMSNYFNYKESDIAFMHDYTPAEWTQLLKNEIDNGRSLLVNAMNLDYFNNWHTSNNIGGHWYHCDGYNEEGEFHVIVGFGNYQYDGYYSIEEFPIYSYNVGILTGLEPDLGGKTLSLTQPNGGEAFTTGDDVEITWQSSGISNLQIEYTLDNGQNWIEIDPATDASAGSYLWTTPESGSSQCKIRLTDTGNINVYDKSDNIFDLMASELALTYPSGGESYVSDDIAFITWEATPVAEIDIEFSADNGSTWNTIVSTFDASQGQYEWDVPQNLTIQGLVRISDSNNGSNISVSNAVFSIVPENVVGGPYKNDANTLLLLHAEGNLYNQSDFTGTVSSENGTISYTDSPIDDLGKSIYLDNIGGSPYLVVPHTSDLNLTDDWTIELWFKPVAYNPGLQYFVWKPGDNDEYFSNYSVQLNQFWGNELYGFYFSGDDRIGVRTFFFPQLNEWYHIAFVRNTGNSSLNVIVRDAQRELVGTYSMTDNGGAPLTNSQDLKIGFNFNGYIDEIRISDVVRSFEPPVTYDISVSANPPNGGTITGSGNFNAGETATLTATSQMGYSFVNWTENGTEVSTDATYSFTVTKNRTLVANFESQSSFGTDNSLEVITWNIEFFPHNGNTTVEYMSSIIQVLDADIIAFQEVADVDVFNQMIENIDGYESFVGTTDDLIKLAYVYKPGVIQVNSIYEIYTGDEFYLPFLRRPLVMECTYEGEDFVIINNHFKALGDGILDPDDPNDEENRRWVATNLIKDYIDDNFSDVNVIVVGDLNDVITDESANNVFQSILDDPLNYAFADYDIAVGSNTDWSYPDYPSHIDHIIITNEIFSEFYAQSSSANTLKLEEIFTGGWDEYTQNISDHRPVALKLFSDETVSLNKDFEDQSLTSGGWTSHNVIGAQTWIVPETQYGHNASYCAYINGYDNGALENENWLVSPAFSPDESDNLYLTFWNTSAYTGPGLQLYWSNNYSGDPQTTDWTEIENVNWHDGNTNWEWTFSEIIDLSNLTGSTAHIAFKYTSTAQGAAGWELDDIILTSDEYTFDISASANPSSGGTISGLGTYTYGETVMLLAAPKENYIFVNWTENGDVVSTNTNYSFTASKDRNFIAHFSSTTSIDNRVAEDFIISPNPALEFIRIGGMERFDVQIFSPTGICVAEHKNVNSNDLINISGLSSGIYFVLINAKENVVCKKIVVR